MVRDNWYGRLAAANRLVRDARRSSLGSRGRSPGLSARDVAQTTDIAQLGWCEQMLHSASGYRALVLKQVRAYPLPTPPSSRSSRLASGSNSTSNQVRYASVFVINGKPTDDLNGREAVAGSCDGKS